MNKVKMYFEYLYDRIQKIVDEIVDFLFSDDDSVIEV
jgi:hypothetical protein